MTGVVCYPTNELREDGSLERREVGGIELREALVCIDIGGGSGRCVFNYSQQWTKSPLELHNAAVRLGTKGGIASGRARSK